MWTGGERQSFDLASRMGPVGICHAECIYFDYVADVKCGLSMENCEIRQDDSKTMSNPRDHSMLPDGC